MTRLSEVPPSHQTFSQMLRFFRLRSGLSQGDLAARANLSPRTISDLERGVRRRAYLPTVLALSLALQLTPPEHLSFSSAVQRARPRSAAVSLRRPSLALPSFTSSFLGREVELASLIRLLQSPECRLITVTGPPGAGKSRLVIEAAHEMARRRAATPMYCRLGEESSLEDVLACLNAIRATSSQTQSRTWHLLVIDNLERLPSRGVDITAILGQSSSLKVLASSRIPAFVQGEQEFALALLSLPEPGTQVERLVVEALATSPAVRLFIDRITDDAAGSSTPGVIDIPALIAISRRLEGLPLAIETAATHAATTGLLGLADLLDQRLDLAPAGDVTQARTLRTTIDQSYQLLSRDEQWAFRRLAVFDGEWTLDDAVDFLIAGSSRQGRSLTGRQVYGILHRIAQHSLLQWTSVPPGVRLRMLGVVHDYARSVLAANNEGESTRDTLIDCASKLSEEALVGLRGRDQNLWLAHLSQRAATIDGALRELRAQGEPDTAASILWNIRVPIVRGIFTLGGRWVSDVLAQVQLSPANEGVLRVMAACLRCREGYRAAAWRHARRGLDLLKLRPWDRIEALRLLPASLLALMPDEPQQPPPGQRAA